MQIYNIQEMFRTNELKIEVHIEGQLNAKFSSLKKVDDKKVTYTKWASLPVCHVICTEIQKA